MTLSFGQRLAAWVLACLIAMVASPAVCAMPAWPQAASDLAADPAVRFGALPNGLRYAILRNDTPKGQVAMRLQIRAGSLHEARDQEGLAHFVEHMAFRGTTKTPDGEMIQSLQRLGLQFGADTNASTSQSATTYMFNLPRSDAASVETGLRLLREIASEITFDPATAKTESGVVLSEERARAGQQLDAARVQIEQIYGDHPYARLPIGRTEVIAAADVGRMRAFYDAYYRPERSVLVVVGDVDPQAIEARITAEFSNWAGKGPAGADPAPLAPGDRPAQFAALDGKPTISQLTLTWIKPYEAPGDSQARLLDRLTRMVAEAAFGSRLTTLAEGAGQPFSGAAAGESTVPGVSTTNTLTALLINDWKASLDLLVKAKGQVEAFGFTQEEVDRVLTRVRAQYKAAVDAASTRPSTGLAEALLASAQSEVVFRSPAAIQADFERLAPQITLARVNARAARMFAGQGPLVLVSAPGAPQTDIAALRAAYDTAAAAAPTRMAQAAVRPWPYADFGRPGAVVERKEIDGLGITQVRFDNGVRLSVRPNTAVQNQIAVRVRFGDGLRDLPAGRPALSSAASTALNTGGLADYSPDELRLALAGKQASATFSIGETESTLSGGTRPADFPLQLQLMAASLSRPGWRSNLYAPTLAAASQIIGGLLATPAAAYLSESDLLLHSGDPRWRTPTAAEITSVPFAEVRAGLEPVLANRPLEVFIAGDITVDAAIAEVARTFGALPPRNGPAAAAPRPVAFPAPTATPLALTHTGRADQAIAAIAWPTTDAMDSGREDTAANVLAAVMRSRLTEQLRAHDGKTYSPSVRNTFSTVYRGYGLIQVNAQVAPVDIDAFYVAVDKVAADLVAAPVSADELARAVSPLVESYSRGVQDNSYWMRWMGRLGDTPWAPDFLRSMPGDLAAITPAQVQESARRWLNPTRAWKAKMVAAAAN